MDEKKTTQKKAASKKEPVERTIIKANTGEKSERPSKPAVVSAENKKKATGLRWGAVALWLLAIGFEVLAILLLNGTLYLPGDAMVWLIAALAVDMVLVIIASQLWKKSNRLDPASKKNKLKFFLWNNMGVIASVIAFVPFIVILLKDKDMDKKSKRIVTVVAAIALLIAGAASVDYDPVSAEDLAQAQEQAAEESNGMAYWTQWGRSYHLDPNCHTLSRSATIYEGTIEEAFEAKRTDPCDFCANGKTDGVSQDGAETDAVADAVQELLDEEDQAE
ncbi:MAG: hypothetical protein EOM66_05955 [Clostridia bacterium]|nr:hypothetical protein [Clostridia bacterium]